MHSTFLTTSVVLAFCFLASAQGQTEFHVGEWSIGYVDDWVASGNYQIYSCSSRAPQVKNFLDFVYLWLQNAIRSTDAAAYTAFFRGTAPDTGIKVLEAIIAGSDITTVFHGPRPPTLVCVNEADPGIRPFWDKCQDSPGTATIQPDGTSLYFLCPMWFDLLPAPERQHCASVNDAGTALTISDQGWILGSQYGFFVRAFAALYIQETLGKKPLAGVIQMNKCLALPPDQAIVYPNSYAYFTSNIRAGCTNFPKHVPIERDRELLAVGDGSDEGSGNGTTNAVAFGCERGGGGTNNSTSCAAG